MEKSPEFVFGHTDREINKLLLTPEEEKGAYTRHFTQEEDFFLTLPAPYTVDSLAYHHDVRQSTPSPQYRSVMMNLLRQLVPMVPDVFHKLTWFFDPRDILHPTFYQVLGWQKKKWLYAVKLDLAYRPRYHKALGDTSNDFSVPYESRHLFFESQIYGLEAVLPPEAPRAAQVKRIFTNTWKGESGRGYFVQGYWIDNEISKFLTKVFLEPGKKIYPYFLLRCHLDTICAPVVDFGMDGRKKLVTFLNQALEVFEPLAVEIQTLLRDTPFDESLELFQNLRRRYSPDWAARFKSLGTKASINALDHKEYQLEGYLD